MKNFSMLLSLIALGISAFVGVTAYQQKQYINTLQNELQTVKNERETELESLKESIVKLNAENQELTKLILAVAENSSLDAQFGRMLQSTKSKIEQHGKEMLDSTIKALEKMRATSESDSPDTESSQ